MLQAAEVFLQNKIPGLEQAHLHSCAASSGVFFFRLLIPEALVVGAGY